ncbi:hypothetical protein FFLO_05965 [Filobasidium floriforme]|uniref:Fungal-type protein kinase domain-containing protein n=1 Tax=Filobasidium floriforme TaxID=5210 RepID=A0A8K0JGB7_9TREE|nr:uncharacterized protein HD553DRAFT_320939 [Filobasidium floriforme]KAG7528739.1 hypothetical protein FFLO_05965 [Filobasidium floriforme]KAH8077282.1 hypothetical protein HD553DRAFT_320939 [Filobasidium floriforme]
MSEPGKEPEGNPERKEEDDSVMDTGNLTGEDEMSDGSEDEDLSYLSKDPPPISGAAEPGFRFTPAGLHAKRFKIVSKPAVDGDFEQDKGANQFTLEAIGQNYPFLSKRYGRTIMIGLPDPKLERRVPVTPGVRLAAFGLNETPMKGEGNNAQQRHTERYYKARDLEAELLDESLKRFDTRFVDLVCEPEEAPDLFDAIKETAQTCRNGMCKDLERFLSVYRRPVPKPTGEGKKRRAGKDQGSTSAGTATKKLKPISAKKPHEDTVSSLLIKALNAMGAEFLKSLEARTTGVDQPNEPSAAQDVDSTLAFAGSGTVPIRISASVPRDAVDRLKVYKPDFFGCISPGVKEKKEGSPVVSGVKRKAATKGSDPIFQSDNIGVLVEVRKDPTCDFKAHGDPKDAIIGRAIRFAEISSYNHSIANRVTTMTVTGTLVRLYFADSFSWATSRVWDLANEEHLGEIVKIVAFFMGAPDQALQQWKPDPHSFSTRGLGPETDRSSVRRWEWVAGYRQEYTLRSIFGRRSTIWSGETRLSGVGGEQAEAATEEKTTIVKAAYLPSGLVHHEYNMVTCLHPESPRSDSLFYQIDEATRAAILKDIPVPLGMVDVGQGEHQQTRRLPKEAGLTVGEAPSDLVEPLTHLELAVFAMHGPVGETVDPRPEQTFSLLEVCEIHLDALGHGYYAATCNIHFRDWSEGNVLFRRLRDGTLRGFLIDYGNARHENKRRDQSRNDGALSGWQSLCLDDMRSGTAWFRCLAVIDTASLIREYTKKQKKRNRFPKTAQGNPEFEEMEAAELEDLKLQMLRARHRYIDDLESFMYLLIFQACKATHNDKRTNDAVIEMLESDTEKKSAWKADLTEIAETISPDEDWVEMVETFVKTIKVARMAMKDQLEKEDMTGKFTPEEDRCYKMCYDLLREFVEKRRRQEGSSSKN